MTGLQRNAGGFFYIVGANSLHCCVIRANASVGNAWVGEAWLGIGKQRDFAAHCLHMVRVGIQESVAEQLLRDFPVEAEIVRLPRQPERSYEVDFWIPPFSRKAVETFLPHLHGVKVVQSLMAGVDWLLPALPPGLTVCDGRGIHDVPTSELVLTLVLASLKRLPLYLGNQRESKWDGQKAFGGGMAAQEQTTGALYAGQMNVLSDELCGRTVLIVGYGSIGAAIEARLKPFDVHVLRVARSARTGVASIAELPQLLPQADVVVLIVPHTPETRGMFGAEQMALMKPGALLINAARGPVVVTDALVTALQQGRIHAAVDVTDPEPLPPGHPLWAAPNCIITPHVGGSTPGFITRAYALAAAQLHRYVKGEPLENIVSESGY